ncbi:MAG: GTP-binding protein [Lachnospiraceae bacterium]|nr:GTP-binding protein [Lachnospiraceae bacterium]
MNETISSMRTHIGFFGLRNVGKSSLVNAVTGQELSIVSDHLGTTTDPVRKAMEVLPLGPVVIIDTPGLDDEGSLGEKRVERTKKVLSEIDLGILVMDARKGLSQKEGELIGQFREKGLPFIIVHNKADLLSREMCVSLTSDSAEGRVLGGLDDSGSVFGKKIEKHDPGSIFGTGKSGIAGADEAAPEIYVSARTEENISELKDLIASYALKAARSREKKTILAGLVRPGDLCLLVIPIDGAAPKGRLILPQQMVLRELLEVHAMGVCCQAEEVEGALKGLSKPPALVITDSQAFGKVSSLVPDEINLTSFSILMARYKGGLDSLIAGARTLRSLRDSSFVLISEGCTHHRQCGDIGSVKLPAWIRGCSGACPAFEFSSGGDFPDENGLKRYSLIVHCGGCMLNEREMESRQQRAAAAGVPIVNYGIAIAEMHGLLSRALRPLGY